MNNKDTLCMTEIYNNEKNLRLEEEVLLPDYNSDIVRVIRVDACPYVTSKKVSIRDDTVNLDVSGSYRITVIYQSDDAEIENYNLTGEFFDTIKAPIPKGVKLDPESISVKVMARGENLSSKVISPRRMSVKGDVVLDTRIFANKIINLCFDDSEEEIESKSCECVLSSIVFSHDDEVTISKEIKLPKSSFPIEKVLSVSLSLDPESASAGSGKVNYHSNAHLVVLYLPEIEDEEKRHIESFYQPIEIKGSFDIASSFGDTNPAFSLTAGNIDYEILPDSFGENRILKVDMTYYVQALGTENAPVNFISDAYAVGKRSCEKYDGVEARRYLGSHRQSVEIKETIVPQRKAVSVEGTQGSGKIKRLYFDEGQFFADAEVSISGIARGEEDDFAFSENMILTLSLDLPSEFSSKKDSLVFDKNLWIGFVDSDTSDGDVLVSFDVIVSLDLFETENVKYVSEIDVQDTLQKEKSTLFYYPTDNETLWDIGKKYSVSQRELRENNSVSEDTTVSRVMKIW